MGQTLVVQQGGIDLSVPGMVSFTIVMSPLSHGDPGKLASAIALSPARSSRGCSPGDRQQNRGDADRRDARHERPPLRRRVHTLAPPPTTSDLANFASGRSSGSRTRSSSLWRLPRWRVHDQKTSSADASRRSAPGCLVRALPDSSPALPACPYVAGALYCTAGVLLAGVVARRRLPRRRLPAASDRRRRAGRDLAARRPRQCGGDGRGRPVPQPARPVRAREPPSVQLLVNAAALAVGLAIYSVPWRRLRRNVRRPSPGGAGRLEQSTEPGVPGL